MSSTVAIALITAVATLSGGCIASATSIIVQRHQIGLQTILSAREHEEQREAQRRQIRRDAYAELLTQLEQSRRLIETLWLEPPPVTPGEVGLVKQQTMDQRYAFNNALNIVYLEGPGNMERSASRLAESLHEETELLDSCSRENVGSAGPLINFRAKDDVEASQERFWRAKWAFIQEAAKALGDEIDLAA